MDEQIREQLEGLKGEHRRLDEKIASLSAESPFDQLEVMRLKKRKLFLKDQIALILDRNTPDIIA